MELRCKPGDLAVVVKSECGNNGKIVRCIRITDKWRGAWIGGTLVPDTWWEIDIPLRDGAGNFDRTCNDSILRPIRDQPGTDETLIYAGKPAPVTKRLTEEQFNEACDRWVMGVEA